MHTFCLHSCSHHRQITLSYFSVDISVRYINVTIAYINCTHSRKSFFSATRSQTLSFGYRRYGRPTPATAGILVYCDSYPRRAAAAVHVVWQMILCTRLCPCRCKTQILVMYSDFDHDPSTIKNTILHLSPELHHQQIKLRGICPLCFQISY